VTQTTKYLKLSH